MSTSCSSIKDTLLKCIAKTPCAAAGGTVKECFDDPALPEECVNIKKLFFECRRGQMVSLVCLCLSDPLCRRAMFLGVCVQRRVM